jgi:PKD repeat protein
MRGIRSSTAALLLVGAAFAGCLDAPTGFRRPANVTAIAEQSSNPAPVIVAAGDVAQCTSLGDEATALLLDALQFDALLALGDLAYEDATTTDFQNCYDPTWGRHKSKTRPTPGNHEYHTPGAAGYFSYFGAASNPAGGGQTYYSFDLGEWHILSLDSNLPATAGSAQLTWIRQDLAAHPKACSLAYWHHPVFSSGIHGNAPQMRDVWRVLDSAGVDVVLVGHDHTYERFAPQTSTGLAIPTGIRQFVVGTGGSKLRPFSTTRANSEVRNGDSWGVLKLTLHPTSYDWEFVPVAGEIFTDQGTTGCVQTAPPEANQQPVATLTSPANGATFTAPTTITLEANAADADGNLNRVEFYRGSTFIGSDATPPYSITWTNTSVGTHNLTARAVDAAEAWASSPIVRVTVAPPSNSAPTVSLDGPLDDANFTAPATITLEASAEDVDGNLNRVEFYADATLLASDATAPYAFTWNSVPAGTYTLTARAVDAADAATTSVAAVVTVDAPPPPNSAPSVSLTGPAANATFMAPATITLQATAADIDGNLSRVEFYHGTVLLGSDATSPYSFTWTDVPAGSYVLVARAVDAAEEATTSNQAQITVTAASSNQPPLAKPGGPYAGTEGVALTLNGSGSSDPENDALTYAWDFGDGTTAAGVSPSKAYGDNGTYTVTLVVSDPAGASHTATTTATIANIAPTLIFVSPTTAASGAGYTLSIRDVTDVAADLVGLQYRFECAGAGGFTPWGTASSATCPGLSGPLTSTARGAVRDKDGAMRQQSRRLEVLPPTPAPNNAPTVSLTGPADGATFTAPAVITLEASADDVDGNLGRVEFYNGTILLTSDATSPYSFAWSNVPAGSYVLTARAVDIPGLATTSTEVRVTVNPAPPSNQPPVANPGGPYSGTEGVAVSFDGGASSDPESAPLSYAWDFGDGTSAVGRSPSKTYGDNGTFTVTLVVSDPSGATHSATTTATIENVAPALTFSAPSTVASGASYTLSISSARDVTADQPSLQYRFECGVGGFTLWSDASSVTCEGATGPTTRNVRGAVRDKDGGIRQQTVPVQILAPPANSAPTVSLTGPSDGATFAAPASITLTATASDVDENLSRVEFYNGPTLLGADAAAPYELTWSNVPVGTYTLTARAVDAADATATSGAVVVTVGPPPPVNTPPVAKPGGPYNGAEGVALTLNGTASTDPERGALTYAWNFGDGTTGIGASPTKTFGDNGTFTVTLVVTDPMGASHSATTTVTIANVVPAALNFVSPPSAASGAAYTLSITDVIDVPADLVGLQYRFECGAGYTLWSAATSVTCPGVPGPVTRVVRGAVRDKDGGVRQMSRNIQILAPPPTN